MFHHFPDFPFVTTSALLRLLMVIVCAVSTACSGGKAATPIAPAVPVLAATVEQRDMPVELQAIGSVEAYSTVSVKTQVTGQLTGVYFQEGKDVRKGDLLSPLTSVPSKPS